MSTFAIGDIHGHSGPLDELLALVPIGEADVLVFMGDYVDKGPDVCGVLDRMVELSNRAGTVFLRGNHDQMMIDAFRDRSAMGVWETLGGDRPLASYGDRGDAPLREQLELVPQAHWNFLETTCQNYYQNQDTIFVHGGIRAHQEPAEEDPERLQWMTLGIAESHFSGRTVVCGHSAQESGKILDLGHTICIDTGISKGGFLSCLRLESSFEFWQVSADGSSRSGMLRG